MFTFTVVWLIRDDIESEFCIDLTVEVSDFDFALSVDCEDNFSRTKFINVDLARSCKAEIVILLTTRC